MWIRGRNPIQVLGTAIGNLIDTTLEIGPTPSSATLSLFLFSISPCLSFIVELILFFLNRQEKKIKRLKKKRELTTEKKPILGTENSFSLVHLPSSLKVIDTCFSLVYCCACVCVCV